MADIHPIKIASQVLGLIALFLLLGLGLLPALLSGLLIYHVVQAAVPALGTLGLNLRAGKIVVLVLLTTVIGFAISFGIVQLTSFLASGSDSLAVLLQKMAEVIETGRIHLPAWASDYLPADVEQLKIFASNWLRGHAGQFREMTRGVGAFFFHILMGMIIGGLVAFDIGTSHRATAPLPRVLAERAVILGAAFRNIVFSQVRISALNTALTALYILVVLPLAGIHLPLARTMIVVTFLVGLLPVLGNLISNTVIVVISLSVSPMVAAGSLVFLIVIHKLEYFLNARIIGSQIRAHAWELLTAMLVMEAAFGVSGLIAAPIYYAYLKGELGAQNLI